MPSPPTHPPDLTVGPAGLVGEPPEFLTVAQLLAEPDSKSGQWVAGVVRRLVAASCRPVAVGLAGEEFAGVRARLDAAGWFCAGTDADLEGAREGSWPASKAFRRMTGVTGSLRPRLIVVGQKQTSSAPYPFASRDGTWLWLALRMLGWDELGVTVTNAMNSLGRRRTKELGHLHEATRAADPTWLAAGRVAEEMLRSLEIPHVYVTLPKPHKQYHHAEGPEGYARLMVEAGLPFGPWRSAWAAANVVGMGESAPAWLPDALEAKDRAPLPVVSVDELPELAEPYAIRSVAFRKGSGAGVEGTKTSGLNSKLRESARQAYVTGIHRGTDGVVTPVRTLGEAASAVGAARNRIYEVARAEGWQAQRDEHEREVTQEAIEAATKQKVKSQARAMQLAWKATEVYLRKVLEDLVSQSDDPKVALNTQGVRHLVWAAIALGQQSVGDVDGGPAGDTSPAAMMKKLEAVIARHDGKAGAEALPE